MAENEKRRDALTAAGDMEAVGVLQDEYLALMLQNEEFLRELSQDNDFMSTLQRGIDRDLVFMGHLLFAMFVVIFAWV